MQLFSQNCYSGYGWWIEVDLLELSYIKEESFVRGRPAVRRWPGTALDRLNNDKWISLKGRSVMHLVSE